MSVFALIADLTHSFGLEVEAHLSLIVVKLLLLGILSLRGLLDFPDFFFSVGKAAFLSVLALSVLEVFAQLSFPIVKVGLLVLLATELLKSWLVEWLGGLAI